MDKQQGHGDSSHHQVKDGARKKRRKSTRAPVANQSLALRPRASMSKSCAEEEPMRSEINPVHDEHMRNQCRLEDLNLRNSPNQPAPSTLPGRGTSRRKSKKRPAVPSEHDHRDPEPPQPQRKLLREGPTPKGYPCSNDSDKSQSDSSYSQPASSSRSRNNTQHWRLPGDQNYPMLFVDPQSQSALRTRPPAQNRIDGDPPAPGSELNTAPRKHLFPPGEWNPTHHVLSPELEELLQMKAVTLANNNDDSEPPPVTPMIREPLIRPLSHEALVGAVDDIHRGIDILEMMCREEDKKVHLIPRLTAAQYDHLIKVHRALLCEHHDLYTSSQHPVACEKVLGLAAKYHMPTRAWAIGIFPLLEIMRVRLPASLDQMILFIHHTLDMMFLLLETVPRFRNFWRHYLGDLSRYRMSLEIANESERYFWGGVARYWYNKCVDLNHGSGKFHHHLGVVAKDNMGQQLFLFSKSLVCLEPFPYARKSVESTFDTALGWLNATATTGNPWTLASWYVIAHAMLIRSASIGKFLQCATTYLKALDIQSGRLGYKIRTTAICLAVPNFAAMFQYGDEDGILMMAFANAQKQSLEERMQHAVQYWAKSSTETPVISLPHDIYAGDDTTTFTTPLEKLAYSAYLTFQTLSTMLTYNFNLNGRTNPYVHISLAFIWSLALVPESMLYVEGEIPWQKISIYLNVLTGVPHDKSKLESPDIPIPADPDVRQLPEDFVIRGQIWTQYTYPEDFFDGTEIEDTTRTVELPSTRQARIERCLWYGHRIASFSRWIKLFEYEGVQQFGLTSYGEKLERGAKHPLMFGRASKNKKGEKATETQNLNSSTGAS
ncbi:hypothetical protein ACJ72_06723 [Emergomyces africanus]|uniref:DNA/RNA-binding domain-containing protein n=1 Tax=Emergomyces africanus TaxID=1955775 RepID=A0A1B7NQ58_9EURO|nr:hypothetical protein ACJ72_06723 [Emergomyces africanus]